MANLVEEVKRSIPSLDLILEEAWNDLRITRQQAMRRFGQMLVRIDARATEIFKANERSVIHSLAEKWLREQGHDAQVRFRAIVSQRGWEAFVQEASIMFAEFGTLVQALEKDLGNMRKARGGKTFEKAIIRLLSRAGVSSESPTGAHKERLRRIDIVVPSIEMAINQPDRAVFLTCKRTLRERWKQEVPQARPNQRYYLVTIDTDISAGKGNEIADMGLIAFVPNELKQQPDLRRIACIRKLDDLPTEMERVL